MQVFSGRWAPPTGVLGRILTETRARVQATSAENRRAVERLATDAPPAPPFGVVLRRPHVSVIAEIKRRSPSRGAINEALDPRSQARAYERGGASAISVLTERSHFAGSIADLRAARAAVELPILRKDFHVDVLQLHEARAAGASAVLLIARALPPLELAGLARESRAIGLETLIEVRTLDELERAVDADASVIGVNSRDLETLAIDASIVDSLVPLAPDDRPVIAESGVTGVEGVERAARAGAVAVLVGSAISAAADPAAAVLALTGVRRGVRAH